MLTNNARAIRARTALIDHYDTMQTDVIDFLTDLMHLCQEDGINFLDCLHLAEIHFNAELSEEA